MERQRKLMLKRETLAELSDPTLAMIVAGTVNEHPSLVCVNEKIRFALAAVSALAAACLTNPCWTNQGCPQITAPNCTGTCATT